MTGANIIDWDKKDGTKMDCLGIDWAGLGTCVYLEDSHVI